MITLTVNGKPVEVDDSDPSMPLLWVLRDALDLVGTKYGCGVGQCGACTVHINGVAMRSCSTPLSAAAGQQITTIEGLAKADGTMTAVQKAWIALDVAQCGYCQSGQIMSATALLRANPKPTDEDINTAMYGNLCRCGTYIRIKAAIHAAADDIAKGGVA
jgi:isoquinoline 1-oxidoreductase alpha subunit